MASSTAGGLASPSWCTVDPAPCWPRHGCPGVSARSILGLRLVTYQAGGVWFPRTCPPAGQGWDEQCPSPDPGMETGDRQGRCSITFLTDAGRLPHGAGGTGPRWAPSWSTGWGTCWKGARGTPGPCSQLQLLAEGSRPCAEYIPFSLPKSVIGHFSSFPGAGEETGGGQGFIVSSTELSLCGRRRGSEGHT